MIQLWEGLQERYLAAIDVVRIINRGKIPLLRVEILTAGAEEQRPRQRCVATLDRHHADEHDQEQRRQ